MKRALGILAVVLACGQAEQPATDTAAMAAPAALTPADVSGTWSGTTMTEGDTAAVRWTAISATGTEGKLVFEGATDSVSYTATFDADSFIVTTVPYADPSMQGAQVTTRAVGRLVGGKLVGTATTMLASQPDSVVARARWESTKQ